MRKLLPAALCALTLSAAAPAAAQSSAPPLQALPAALESALPVPEVEADSWLIADFASGWIMAGNNMDARIEPASLTKLMTGYLVFDAPRARRTPP